MFSIQLFYVLWKIVKKRVKKSLGLMRKDFLFIHLPQVLSFFFIYCCNGAYSSVEREKLWKRGREMDWVILSFDLLCID